MNNKSDMRICQWNCRGVRGKIFELDQFADNWDVILLVETYLKPDQKPFHIKKFNTVRFDRLTGPRGGIAFLIKNNLIFDSLGLDFSPKSLEVGAITISTSKGKLAFIGCYRAPGDNNNLSVTEWQNFMLSIRNSKCDIFFIGDDLNAHHSVWGSTKNCPNGNIIYIILQTRIYYTL